MTEKTNTPELRFPEFREGWKEFILNDVSIKKSKKNKNNLYNETFTNSAEYGIVSQKEYFDKEISNKKNLNNYYIVEPNDFVYNPRISNLAPVGPINRNKLNRTGVMSPLYTVFSTKLSIKSFLEYYFKTSKWHRFMKLNGDSGARSDRFTIKQSLFIKMPIFLPSNQEQEKIGDFFSKLDQQIELEEKKLELLEQQKKGYMQKLFSQDLRFKDENGNDYLKWKNKPLGNLVNITMGQSPSSKNYTENSNYTTLVQGNADLNNGYIQPRIYTKQITKLAEVNDILLTVRAPVGKIGRAQLKACIGRGVCAIKGDSFIYYFLELFDLQNKWIRFSQGSTFESISGNEIKNIDIAYPVNEERQKISEFLSKLDKLLKNQLLKVEQLKQRKQGLLQRMFI